MEVLTLTNEVTHLQTDNNNLKNNSIKITALLERLEKDKSDLVKKLMVITCSDHGYA